MHGVRIFLKRFGTDIAGYTCLILVLPIGALPGPGGIPLLIAGLGLLSIHNKWARNLLDYVKKHSDSLRTVFFPKNKYTEAAWDILAAALFISAFVISILSEHWFFKGLGAGVGAFSTTLFMFNRSRLDRLRAKFQKR